MRIFSTFTTFSVFIFLSPIGLANGTHLDPKCPAPTISVVAATPCCVADYLEKQPPESTGERALKHMSTTTAGTFKAIGKQVAQSHKETMDTIDMAVKLFSGLIIIVVGLVAGVVGTWGIKDYRELKTRHYAAIARVTDLTNEVSAEKVRLTEHIDDAMRTFRSMEINSRAQAVLGAARGLKDKLEGEQNEGHRNQIKRELEVVLREVEYKIRYVLNVIKPTNSFPNSLAHALLGTVYHIRGGEHYYEAISEFREAIDQANRETADPRFNEPVLADTHYNLACTYAKLQNRSSMLEHLIKAINIAAFLRDAAPSDSDFKEYQEDQEFKHTTMQPPPG